MSAQDVSYDGWAAGLRTLCRIADVGGIEVLLPVSAPADTEQLLTNCASAAQDLTDAGFDPFFVMRAAQSAYDLHEQLHHVQTVSDLLAR